ncbi:hypothetical protein AQUCO_08500002v1 [Aquilegia coerulea]|uniref:non-specific serine/threonine protein kinase n=1 Tax=Aquilegia coerulea TaxID=218851 RepID=A0A2G5C6K5_AQUCA|nr:hypothetical protein AQUCO_08500002v1 [Aquilegia coerulea]
MDMINPIKLEGASSGLVIKCLSELGPKSYSNDDLMSFTSNFSESNKIGSGGYGEVYKGRFPSGVLVAVKILKNKDVVEETFMAEIRTIGKVFHRNLVKLLGYCFEDNMKALVYEYMENGSLDKILYENHHSIVEWVKLYGIAIEIANGLNYLHDGLEDQIIHHDIKASNVLLDKNFSAKITDFGLAKPINRDVCCVPLTRTRGTVGYNAPETWMPNSQVTFKCDVYSFGMMLFEILGKRSNGMEENWFPGLVWKQFVNGKLEHIIRDCGIPEKDKEKAIILSKVALRCVQYTPELRPSMKDVVLMLEKKLQVRDPPNPFLFGQISTLQVDPEELRTENIERIREWSDSLEPDLTHPQNIHACPTFASVAGGGNNGPGGDSGVTLQQMKSNVPKRRSSNILKEDLASLVPNKCMELATTKLVGKTTALKYSEMILQWIAKDEVVTVGIHGMGGVGKTTILKDVHNQVKLFIAEQNCFDKIIWVTVSKDGNIAKLQNDIAKALDLKLSSEDDVLERSRLLFQALEWRKRVVIFFDDMWKSISLDEIGIPQPTQENRYKLILTTRSLDVCKRMGCHKDNTITVKPLPKDEAWELFMNKVDQVLIPEVRAVAEMVAEECSGLPLAVITVGAAMRGNCNIDDWKVALNDLRDFSNRIMDMEDIVFKRLKFSYDRLTNKKLRMCFLYCALYPEDYRILTRDLVDFWITDGLIEERNRQDDIRQGQFIVRKLKDHCLLESVDAYDNEYGEIIDGVKMHDLIRDMALRLTNKCFMVKAGACLKDLPNEEEWERGLERTSFMDNDVTKALISPSCPNLSTLFLRDNYLLNSIAHDFFVHMQCLRVLDLRCNWGRGNFQLESLPDSLSYLVNLRALRLSGCMKLVKLPSLAKLVLLRTLELNHTAIEKLPEGIKMLVNLRCLNLHAVELRETIPTGLISKLSALQELYLGGISVDKLYDVGRGESFAQELLSLKELENLNVSFHCLSDYASYVGSSKFNGLVCFYLAIAPLIYDPGLYLGRPPRATVLLCYSPGEHTTQNAPLFPQNTKRVAIHSFHNLRSLNELGWLIKDVRDLVVFAIRLCEKMECIWSWSSEDENEDLSGSQYKCWLQALETIDIYECPKLYTLFNGIPTPTPPCVLPFFCLKVLMIYNCHNLENVFSSSKLLQLLPNLEEIYVCECNKIEELIGDEEEEKGRSIETPIPVQLPMLKKLKFSNLRKLKRIWRGVMICDSLERVCVDNCSELKTLPQFKGEEQSIPPTALKEIIGSRKWWDSLEWDLAYPKNIIQPFFKFKEDCTYAFPTGVYNEFWWKASIVSLTND